MMIANQMHIFAADCDLWFGCDMHRSQREEAILGELGEGIEEFGVGFFCFFKQRTAYDI